MKGSKVLGLRLFLLTVLELISKGKKETCSYVEEAIKVGVATALSNKYPKIFNESNFVSDWAKSVDTYYKEQWSGYADNQKDKYGYGEDDGLKLVIALVLNEIN